jgi:hypothetical protein
VEAESFRLDRQTIGIDSSGEGHVCVLVPKGAIVTVIGGPLDGNRMVDVKWERATIMMFVEDLRARGTLVQGYTGNA